jgi:hypothetical protein
MMALENDGPATKSPEEDEQPLSALSPASSEDLAAPGRKPPPKTP